MASCRLITKPSYITDIILIAHQGGMDRVGGSGGDAIVQEMIRIAMQMISARQGYPHVTKKQIQEALFQVRERLHHKNPVKRCLAYYWHMDGPYSEKVYAGIEQLVQDGTVMRSKASDTETYRLVPERALMSRVDHDDHIDEACSEIGRVVEEGIHVGRMLRTAYAGAPFELYRAYNLEFRPKFESHLDAILDGRKSRYTNGDILNLLDDAVLAYPPPPKFMEHRRIFMDFVKMLNALLRSDASSMRKDLLKTLQGLSHKVWDVFAYGVRIDHHDPYYDYKVEKWTRMYKRELIRLDDEIRAHMRTFETAVVDDTRLSPDIEDMIQHPEKHEFTPVVLSPQNERAWQTGRF